MKVVVVGLGTIGSAVKKLLEERGHNVVSVGRKSGDFQADISDPASLKKLFAAIGQFDAVANAAGDVFPRRWTSPIARRLPVRMVPGKAWARSISSAPRSRTLRDKGSFTLISGVMTDEYMQGGHDRDHH
jgi:NAD dependent epimerase/dehydratase family enzyme